MSWGRKGLLVVCSMLFTLLFIEAAMRVFYPDLPSKAALAEDGDGPESTLPLLTPGGGIPPCPPLDEIRRGGRPRGTPTPPPGALRFLVGGDSVADGIGSTGGRGFAALLARRLGEHLGRPVHLENVARNGANMCISMPRFITWLQDGRPPDIALFQVFADDLEWRIAYRKDDSLVLLPERIRRPLLRWWASNSYLANFAWYALSSSDEPGARRYITPEGREQFKTYARAMREHAKKAGVPLVVVLVKPTGDSMCAVPPAENTPCSWWAEELALMKALLEEEGITPVDLSDLWAGAEEIHYSRELKNWRANPRRLPIHPNNRGHKMLADAIFPALLTAMGKGDANTSVQAASPRR